MRKDAKEKSFVNLEKRRTDRHRGRLLKTSGDFSMTHEQVVNEYHRLPLALIGLLYMRNVAFVEEQGTPEPPSNVRPAHFMRAR